MASPFRNRSACDRCHAQKLRCAKQSGSLVCTRCSKAGARCIYSPPGTTATTATTATGNNPSCSSPSALALWNTPEGLSNGAFDWALGADDHFDFNSFLSPAVQQTDRQDNVSPQAVSPHNTGSSQAACLQKLTRILLDADDLWVRLPLQSTLHIAQAESHNGFLDKLPDTIATNTLLEGLFSLAQQLIDLYPEALDSSFSGKLQADPGCDIPNCTHVVDLPASLSALENQVLECTRSVAPDLTVTNLLVSCHMRFLDILDRIFLMVTACTRVTLASRREPEFERLEMSVGSFIPHRPAAVSMQIALLGHLVARLADRISLMDHAISAFEAGHYRDCDELVVLRSQHKLLAKRQKQRSQQVGVVEDFLKHFALKNEMNIPPEESSRL